MERKSLRGGGGGGRFGSPLKAQGGKPRGQSGAFFVERAEDQIPVQKDIGMKRKRDNSGCLSLRGQHLSARSRKERGY